MRICCDLDTAGSRRRHHCANHGARRRRHVRRRVIHRARRRELAVVGDERRVPSPDEFLSRRKHTALGSAWRRLSVCDVESIRSSLS